MSSSLAEQIAAVGKAPVPFLLLFVATSGIIWQALKWRYDSIIEGLEHRIKLRDDTISRHEKELGANIAAPSRCHEEGEQPSPKEMPDIIGPASFPPFSAPDISRSFIANSVTPEHIRNCYKDRTSIQGDREAALYITKWMRISGKVRSVYDHSGARTRVRLLDADSDASGIKGLWLTFDSDRSILETLKPGDTIFAIGQVKSASIFDVEYESCELIKAE